jgi:zinc transport system substrate-binding protein
MLSRWSTGLLGFVLAGMAACGGSAAPVAAAGQVQVVAAFYPLQFVVEQVGGTAVAVESLTPSGVEPHDLELSSGQIRALSSADLIVYLGLGFQPAVQDALVGMDRDLQFDALMGGEDLLRGENEEGEPAPDPHVWLDPSLLASIADQIATRLADADPENADMFADNAERLQDELEELDGDLATGLKSCASRDFVTSHEAFGYLAARYDLEQVSISGIDPEAEPSPKRLAELARFVEDHDVTTIFFEELAPPDLAETLARETGARTDVLSPLETPPEQGDYLDEMRANLDRLRTALDCE